ncbi:MAG: hypothetical protein ACNS62_19515 [Candidatus Cyclobacteriaceae bacterium M3_2C_046]
MAKHIYIRLYKDHIYFNDTDCLKLEDTNLPDLKEYLQKPVYWKLKQKSFDSHQTLKVEVEDFFSRGEELISFFEQKAKKQIRRLDFEHLRAPDILVQSINYYIKHISGRSYAQEPNRHISGKSYDQDSTASGQFTEPEWTDPESNSTVNPVKNELIHIEKYYSIPFNHSVFLSGIIAFEKSIFEIGKEVTFHIENAHIIPEYEFIKGFFIKALKKRNFKVKINLVVKGDEILEQEAYSKEIEAINDDLVESVKFMRTIQLTKKVEIKDPDKSLFNSDEVFDEFNDQENEGNIFNQSEDDILKFLLTHKNVRNRHQLEYLAGKMQSTREKLRFTLSPHFGFLFLLEGEQMYHYCWELLNSHATYIWSLEKEGKNLYQCYKRVEQIINSIRLAGRESYKNAYRLHHQDTDLVFSVINHQKINSHLKDGFSDWKQKLEERII